MQDIPKELTLVREAAFRAIAPIRAADESTKADPRFLFTAKRTKAGYDLPPYHLVYFLLVDLLGFRNLGQFEKIAWSVPIDFEGRYFLIEYRKLGLGVFVHDPDKEEASAQRIVSLVKKGVKVAEPYFEWVAERAVQDSKLNVVNRSGELFERFQYFLEAHRAAAQEAEERKDESEKSTREVPGGTVTTYHMPAFKLRSNARWLAIAAVDAFFSWTEHMFIHLAILRGTVTSGIEVAELADASWQDKFKRALDVSDTTTKRFFDELIELRRQLRNFMAHGAFGKQGEAFRFHSGTGAVPLLLPHKVGRRRFALSDDLSMEDAKGLEVIQNFIKHLWSGEREPGGYFIQESQMPLVLTYARDGTYRSAMESMESMKEFMEYQGHLWDQAANMDW
jgi:hypothetical protein